MPTINLLAQAAERHPSNSQDRAPSSFPLLSLPASALAVLSYCAEIF